MVCVALVVAFRSSSALASAYGVAVTLTMLTTTALFYCVATIVLCGLLGLVETSFFASNVLKLVHGGWLPIVIGGILFYGMTTWKIGREHIRSRLQSIEGFQGDTLKWVVPRVKTLG